MVLCPRPFDITGGTVEVEKKDIIALAGLDLSPDDILAKERARLEEEIEILREAGRHQRGMRARRTEFGIAAAFVGLVSLGVACLALAGVSRLRPWNSPIFFMLGVPALAVGLFYSGLRERLRFRRLVRRYPNLDQYYGPYEARLCDEFIPPREKELADLSLATTVTQTYLNGLRFTRNELLGPASELVRAKQKLEERMKEVSSDVGRLWARVKDAKRRHEKERSKELKEAIKSLQARYAILQNALDRATSTIGKIEGVIAGCEEHVRGLKGSLGDAELLQEIAKHGDLDAKILSDADAAVNRSMDNLRGRLLRIHVATQAPAALLTQSDETITEWLRGAEAAAEHAAELEVAETKLRKMNPL